MNNTPTPTTSLMKMAEALPPMFLLVSDNEYQKNKKVKRRIQIAYLYTKDGLTESQIAKYLKVAQATVSRDIKKLGLEKVKRTRPYKTRPSRYKKFRYCVHCKWIPIHDLKTLEKSYCPKCNKYKLRVKSKKLEKKEVKRF